MMDHVDREGAKEIIKEITNEYNIKIDNKVATYRKLSNILKGHVLWKLINQIACITAMGSRTKDIYDYWNQNMVECKKEMTFAKKNAHALKKMQTEMRSAIDKFLEDNILQEANTEFQVSSSDEGRTLTTKINNDNVSYHELEKFIKRKILSQLIEHIGGWAARGSSLHTSHENFKQDMEVFQDEIKEESVATTKLIKASAHMLSSIEMIKNNDELEPQLRALEALTSESASGDVGDGTAGQTDLLSQASAKQQELSKGKDSDKTKNPAQGKDEETKGSGK